MVLFAGISWEIGRTFSKPGESVDVLEDHIEQHGVNNGTPVEQSSEKVKEVINTEFNKKNSTNSSILVLHKEGDLPKYMRDKGYTFDGKVLLNSKGKSVLATTTFFYVVIGI